MKKITSLFFALLFGGIVLAQVKGAPKKPSGPLDTKIYIIEIFLDGKEKKWNDDEIKFNGGRFTSPLFKDWDFAASPYEGTVIDSTSENNIIIFSCETKPNPKKEIMIWSGTVTGKEIEGTIELQSSKGKTMKSYNFTGSLKEKKVPQKK